jgi:hypothetical protein
MKHGLAWGLALAVCGIAAAGEPPSHALSSAATPATPVTRASPGSSNPAAAPATKPLDLRIGDVRKYMMPRDFQRALRTPDADTNTVVVEGQRDLAPMRMVEDVPMGLPSLWYSVKDPKNAWRLLAPAVTFKDGPTYDKVPPPVFRWGP